MIFFPTAGFRANMTGVLTSVGFEGQFWSASPFVDAACGLLFRAADLFLPVGSSRTHGRSLRCVQAFTGSVSG